MYVLDRHNTVYWVVTGLCRTHYFSTNIPHWLYKQLHLSSFFVAHLVYQITFIETAQVCEWNQYVSHQKEPHKYLQSSRYWDTEPDTDPLRYWDHIFCAYSPAHALNNMEFVKLHVFECTQCSRYWDTKPDTEPPRYQNHIFCAHLPVLCIHTENMELNKLHILSVRVCVCADTCYSVCLCIQTQAPYCL